MPWFALRFGFLLLLSGALWGGCTSRAVADPAVYEIGDDPGVGFNLISWWNFGSSGASTWQNAVQSVYDAGFREVSISPVRFVNIDTGAILATSQRGPELSHIAAGVARAESLGMRVTLNPFVELYDADENQYFADLPGGCTWRGCYSPTPGSAQATQFWNDYENYLLEVAAIAQAHGVEAMTVGTEYNALDGNSGHNASWDEAIDAAAAVYDGQLGYASNWDHYNHSNVRSAIWNHPEIDFLGIDSYFTGLVSNSAADASGAYPDPTFIGATTSAWTNKLENEILPYAAGLKEGEGLPVVFTEVGYLPYNRTARDPQNSSGQPLDSSEQIMAFHGLINALDGRADVFHAMHIWQWGMPGSDGSLWNIDPTLPANQPNNVPLGQWLSSYVQTATMPQAGDYNRDGSVDAADYTLWRDTMGQFVANFNAADGSASGVIDAEDFEVWKVNFSAGSSGAASRAAVPEPASGFVAAMLTLSVPLIAARRREPDASACRLIESAAGR